MFNGSKEALNTATHESFCKSIYLLSYRNIYCVFGDISQSRQQRENIIVDEILLVAELYYFIFSFFLLFSHTTNKNEIVNTKNRERVLKDTVVEDENRYTKSVFPTIFFANFR